MAGETTTEIYNEVVSKTSIDISPYGELFVIASEELVAKILAMSVDCTITIKVEATCPEKPSAETYGDRVQINYGCRGQEYTAATGDERRDIKGTS